MYVETPLRRPTFDIKKIIKPFISIFVRIFDSMVEARQMQAYYNLAVNMQHEYPNKSIPEIIQILKEGK